MLKKILQIPNRLQFLKFLDTISKISDSCILDITESKITALINSIDNTLILYGEYICNHEFAVTLNIPTLNKLIRILESLTTDDLSLNINSNNLEYKGKAVKFKYHLFDDGFLTKPALKLEKILSFKYDANVSINSTYIQQLVKGTTFATETDKVYFYTEEKKLIAQLTDRARHNTDSLSLEIAETDIELVPLPVNVENIRLLSLVSKQIEMRINTQIGVISFDIISPDIKLQYIITSLTQ